MPSFTGFFGVSQMGEAGPSDQLEANLYAWCNWAMLGIGGFTNVSLPASGSYGGSAARLRLATDPNYLQGQVWEGFRKDWVWESGVEYPYQPIRVSGVYVNGSFHSLAETGAYSHHIDYPLGRVVFNSPIHPTGDVKAEYSYRQWQVYTADTPWWQEVQPDSFRVDNPGFLQQGSGAWDVLGQNRVQLPAMVIEAVPDTRRRPFEIGNRTAIVRQSVLFHILAETRPDMKRMHDTITTQWEGRLKSFDKNALFANNAFPLDDGGSPVPSGLMYPQLVNDFGTGYGWRQIRLMEMASSPQPRLGNLWYCTVRVGCEFDF